MHADTYTHTHIHTYTHKGTGKRGRGCTLRLIQGRKQTMLIPHGTREMAMK